MGEFTGLKAQGQGNRHAEREAEKLIMQAESGVGAGTFYLQHMPSTPGGGR